MMGDSLDRKILQLEAERDQLNWQLESTLQELRELDATIEIIRVRLQQTTLDAPAPHPTHQIGIS